MSGSHRKLHRTMSGREINMEALRSQHADMKARGNASMNARGDILDANGQVKVRREQIVQAYNENKAANSPTSLKNKAIENSETPAQAIARMEQEINARRAQGEQVADLPNLAPKKPRRVLLDKSE